MKVIDRILDFPNADWGEDRIFICENTVGVIDGASPISVVPIGGYHSQAEWLADNLAKELEEWGGTFIPDLCRNITTSLRNSDDLTGAELAKKYYPCATFGGISCYLNRVNAFVLSDCTIVFERNDGILEVLTDNRIKRFSDKTKEVRKLALERGEDVTKAVKQQMTINRQAMNTDGGFWTVSLYGSYWGEFAYKTFNVHELKRCLIMSDGFERVFSYRLVSFSDVLSGKVSLKSALQILRDWENNNESLEVKRHDDASAILVEF